MHHTRELAAWLPCAIMGAAIIAILLTELVGKIIEGSRKH